jgi:hypothetical protein
MHQASEGSDRSQQPVDIPGLMEAMRPFVVMVCEEIAKALVKVIFAQGPRDTLPTASRQTRSRVVSSREEALRGPMVEEGLPNSRACYEPEANRETVLLSMRQTKAT